MVDESDLDLAFRLQMEEAIAASLAFHVSSPPRSPPPSDARRGRSGVALSSGDEDTSSYRLEATGTEETATVRWIDRQSLPREIGRTKELDRPDTDGEFGKTLTCDSYGSNVRMNRSFGSEKPYGEGSNYENTDSGSRIDVKNEGESSSYGKSYGEGSSRERVRFGDSIVYRLYFKGLVSEERVKANEVLQGFGIAILDQRDNLVRENKFSAISSGAGRQGTEIKALMCCLEEARDLGIKHIAIFCDYYPVYQFLRKRWTPRQKHNAKLMDHVIHLRNQFAYSQTIFVARNEIKHAFKLAREAVESHMSEHAGPTHGKAAQKETCVICLEDSNPESIFSVDKCFHRYCLSCVQQYVEVKLRHGIIPTCPHEGCQSKLNIDACEKFMTPKFIEMWKQRMKEASIPVTEKVYCPYPRCSALMSTSEISKFADSVFGGGDRSGARKCVKCHGLFCIDCKVPWHSNLSCSDHKRMNPNSATEDVKLKSLAKVNLWRQCVKCQHMIELSEGCYHITCRCGYEFCYNCGAEWKNKQGTCSCPLWEENYIFHNHEGDFDDDDDIYLDNNGDDGDDDDDDDDGDDGDDGTWRWRWRWRW